MPWGAGGGTDATGRILASILERELGVPVNVVNRTGGSGVVGHSAIATATPDGYTLGIITVEIGMMHWQGLTELTYKDYTPLALYNEDPAGLQVRADRRVAESPSSCSTRSRPAPASSRRRAPARAASGIWRSPACCSKPAWRPTQVPWVPSQGAAPGLQDLVAGGVDIVPCSVPEAQALLDAGKVRSLAVMSAQRNPAFPDVPTLKEATGLDWTVAALARHRRAQGHAPGGHGHARAALGQIWQSQEFK